MPAKRLLGWLGLGTGKSRPWKDRYGKANEHNGKVPRALATGPQTHPDAHDGDRSMAHGKPPKSNQRALLPANVPGIVRELHRLALAGNASAGGQKPRDGGGGSLVVRGK